MVWQMQQQYADSFFSLFLLFYSFLAVSTGRPILASAINAYTANNGAIFFQVDFFLYVYKYKSISWV